MKRSQREDLREAFLRHVCQTSAQPLGIVVARASGTTIWDADGRAYLDLLAGMGVANLGHAHPAVVRAIEEQIASYLHVAVYGELVQRPQVELARRLAETAPGDLSVVYFTNSGTEAVEGALKTARKRTGRTRLIAFDGAFHGDTFGALSVGGNPLYRRPFEPLLPDVEHLPFNDHSALDRIDDSVAGVIVEPVQGEGGVRIPDATFLPVLRERCTRAGALLIADEVITGFGRTGRLFACEHWNVVPDILVLAKALGGGMPLGAFVARPEVMQTLSHDPPLAHVTTFGGHPVSCAAGLAALDVLLSQRLAERAARVGRQWVQELESMAGNGLREVRGIGLLIALELDHPEATQRFVRRCFERGLILNWTLHRDTVVRLAPPLTITPDEIARANGIMREAMAHGAF
ncbi:MAG: aspartate aminotransferase family protein [Candidatus Binatia bacterium]